MPWIKRFRIAVVLVMFPLSAYSEIPMKGLDESCTQEMNQLSQSCDITSESIKQCVLHRLSPDCAKKAGTERVREDPSCTQEIAQAAMPCAETVMASVKAFGKQCMEKNFSQRCKEQLIVAGKAAEAEKLKASVSQGGLTWMPISSSDVNYWEEANASCINTANNGQTKWRLPTKDELIGLSASGALKNQGWALANTWSSTPNGSGNHYTVFLTNGIVLSNHDMNFSYVSCVR
jgi:hypothetical protein